MLNSAQNLYEETLETRLMSRYERQLAANRNRKTMNLDPKEQIAYRQVLDKLSPNPGAEMLWYARNHEDVLSLAQGEGDFATPAFIADAAREAMGRGKTFYGPVLGHPELREEISSYYQRIYKKLVPANRVFVTGSGTTAMHLALTSILDAGDDVVAVTPIWKNLLGAVELAQASITQVPLEDKAGDWVLDLDRLFEAVTPKTKAIILVTPSNPTGWMADKETIKAILDFARERGLWIVSDEVYGRITYDVERAPSFLDYADDDDRLYVVNSFSKSWAMTGWRLGWLVGPVCAEERVRDIALYDNMGPASFMQFAAIKALQEGEEFLKKQLTLWKANRQTMMERLKEFDHISINEPDATLYGFFKIEGESDSIKLAKKLIDREGLSLAPGCAFGKSCQSYLRLCFAVSEEKFGEALDRLGRVLSA